MGIQERGGEIGGEPGCGGGRPTWEEKGAGSHGEQWGDNVVRGAGAEAILAGVGALLRWPRPSSVPQALHRTPHLPPQGFQQVQVHAHVRHRRQEQKLLRSQRHVLAIHRSSCYIYIHVSVCVFDLYFASNSLCWFDFRLVRTCVSLCLWWH